MIQRAIFTAPKECSQEFLELEFQRQAAKFVDYMDRQGWQLVSKLEFRLHPAMSRDDKNDNHYVILGYFKPRFPETEWVFENVPEHVAQKVLKKYGKKARRL